MYMYSTCTMPLDSFINQVLLQLPMWSANCVLSAKGCDRTLNVGELQLWVIGNALIEFDKNTT